MNDLLKSKRASLLGSLVSQNMTLKLALIVTASVILIETIALVAVGMKRPLVVGLTKAGPEILMAIEDENTTGPQIRAFIFDLLSKKFPPKPSVDKLKLICPYFSENLQAACEKELSDKKTILPQDFLVKELVWNDKNENVRLLIKRFVSVGGNLTTVDSLINLHVVQRSRTPENPWGLFIDSWKEEALK